MNKTTRLSERSPFPVAVRAAGLLVLLLSALAGGQRQGAARQATLPPQQLTASDVAAFAAFGVAVALSGTTAVVGAYLANGFLGEAYVFVRQGGQWVEQATLNVPSPAPNTRGFFGQSVALDGDTIAIGAPDDSGGNKGVYVFVRNGAAWTFQQRLNAGDGGQSGDRFGFGLALSGNTLVAGAPMQNGQRGAAYVYTRSGATWTQQQKLTVDGIVFNANFGSALALDGDRLLAGAPGDGPRQLDAHGAVYFFTRSGGVWTQQQRLQAGDPLSNAQVGVALALDGVNLAVGANFVGGGGGAAYVFTQGAGNWTQQAKVSPAVVTTGFDQFGFAVGLSGDVLLVGAHGAAVDGRAEQGAAELFRRNGANWEFQERLSAADGAARDRFGTAVAAHGRFLFVGADKHRVGSNDAQGAVYAYELPPPCPLITIRVRN